MRNANLIRRRRTPLVGWYQRILNNSGLQSLYDPSDLTSIYQSRTGGSTGAVDSVVGIMLDKSEMGGKTAAAFIAGQSELVTNGGFDADASWSKGQTAPATVGIAAGKLTLVSPAGESCYATQNILTVGSWYRVRCDVTVRSGSVKVQGGNSAAAGPGIYVISTTGSHDFMLRCTGVDGVLFLTRQTACDADFDNVRVCEIPGYHALAPSDAARGILARVPATGRRNLLTYTEDFGNAVWAKNAGATATGQALTFVNNTSYFQHPISTILGTWTTGDVVTVKFKASIPSGTTTMQVRIVDNSDGTPAHSTNIALTTTPTYFEINQTLGAGITAGQLGILLHGNSVITAGTVVTITELQLERASSATAYQKVVSARDVTEAGVADKYYLDTDGTDDWMQIFPTLNLGEQWWHVGGWQADANSDWYFTTSNDGKGGLLRHSSLMRWYDNTSTLVSLNTAGSPGSAHVATIEQTATGSLSGRYNGAASVGAITPFDDSGGTQGLALFTGVNSAYSGGLDGRFYGGAFGTGTLTSTDRALLERYVAGLTGVTL